MKAQELIKQIKILTEYGKSNPDVEVRNNTGEFASVSAVGIAINSQNINVITIDSLTM